MGQWQSWSEFWNMGERAFYVWWSYGVTFGLIALELVLLRMRRQSAWQRLLRWRRATGRQTSSLTDNRQGDAQ